MLLAMKNIHDYLQVHTFMKCMEVLKREDLEKPSSSSPATILGAPKKSVMKKSQNAGSSENESLIKALSKQLTCDFLINEVSKDDTGSEKFIIFC